MEKGKCPNKAEFVVSWAGELKMACKTHAGDLLILGEVMGSPVEARPIITDEDCYGNDDFEEREKVKAESESK